MPAALIPFPQPLRPALPLIVGNADYRQLRAQLLRIDEILQQSGIERRFVAACLEQWLPRQKRPSVRSQLNHQLHSRRALRCNLLRTLLREDFRGFAVRLADSPLFQHFCELAEIDRVVVPGKSTLQRYAHWIDHATMERIIQALLAAVQSQPKGLRLAEPLDLEACFLDTTCLQANIHYPVDWVLLRDATRTLMKAVTLIRSQGLRHRMEAPATFITRMNRLCIEMTHTFLADDRGRRRKRVLRRMDRVVACVQAHARRYRQLLDAHWERTGWTRPQAEQVLRRLDAVLGQLPAVRRQARQRILRGQPVANAEKILSLYDPSARVVVRHKPGAEVEFGNKLLLGETRQGLIVDWELFERTAPMDARLVPGRVRRLQSTLPVPLKELAADRGFDSADNQDHLAKRGIYNGICPRGPGQLRVRMQGWKFARLQRRRSQTEARIGIFIHHILGSPLRSKGFTHRQLAVDWGVLTHNLWVLARLPQLPTRQRHAA